jgi:hypothetical protein
MKSQPVVLVTIDGGIADVTASKGVHIVMVDFDQFRSGDIQDNDRPAIIKQLHVLMKRKDLEQEFKAEIRDALDILESDG